MEFAPHPFEHWNSHLILSKIGFRTLCFTVLKFRPYFFKPWKFASFPFKHWNSHLILLNVGIRSLCFLNWIWDDILLDIAILTFFLQTLEFAICRYNYWNLEHILLNTEICPSQRRLSQVISQAFQQSLPQMLAAFWESRASNSSSTTSGNSSAASSAILLHRPQLVVARRF